MVGRLRLIALSRRIKAAFLWTSGANYFMSKGWTRSTLMFADKVKWQMLRCPKETGDYSLEGKRIRVGEFIL